MKKILLSFFLILSAAANAQKLPDVGLTKVRINEADKTIVAEIGGTDIHPSAKPNLSYYWYSANQIHSTQGGFSGTLLNGQYTEYYLNKNLKEQGAFKKGLKDDVWKSWNEDGTLKQTVNWHKGLVVIKNKSKFWKHLPFWHHRHKTDSLAKPVKPVKAHP
jgi:antitoxin component YwqK of YwqJK toxin-antitoxin module